MIFLFVNFIRLVI